MPTNDNMRKLEKILHDDFLVTPLLMLQLEAEVDKKARSDATNQIFKKLDKEQYVASDPIMGDSTLLDTGDILITKEEYQALKKQFKVNEK